MSAYRLAPALSVAIVGAAVGGARRSVGADSMRMLRTVKPLPRIEGNVALPADGRFILVANHYERPGLWAGWGAMLSSAIVWQASAERRDLCWLITAELLDVRLGPLAIPHDWTRAALARFAAVYGFGLVSARESGLVGGAAGLRRAARELASGRPVGVLPEGTASRALCEARPGVGAFLGWLTRGTIPLVPVGIYEQDGVLLARVGAPFHLPRSAGERTKQDAPLRRQIMVEIARLLPPTLWGHYADAAAG